MISLCPFQRAAIIALAWCLVGLGIDTGANSRRAPGQSSEFANSRSTAADNAVPDRDRANPEPK